MVLVSEVLERIGGIYSPFNLANMKSQKLKFVRNTAPDNQRVLNFMRNPYWHIFLFSLDSLLITFKSLYNSISDLVGKTRCITSREKVEKISLFSSKGNLTMFGDCRLPTSPLMYVSWARS